MYSKLLGISKKLAEMKNRNKLAVAFASVSLLLTVPSHAAEAPHKDAASHASSVVDLFRQKKAAAHPQAKGKKTKQAAAKTGHAKARTAKGSAKPGAKSAIHSLVSQFAREYGVPDKLAHAVVTVESNYYPKAHGKDGEIGLMQIMPATARGMGYRGSVKGLYKPETNIRYGMKYLAGAYKLGGKTTCGTILKYNAGHGARHMNPISSAYCAKVKRILGN